VYVCRDSYLLILGGGVLVYQVFLFLKGSRGDFFRYTRSSRRKGEFFF
jgi:hypothetical protein